VIEIASFDARDKFSRLLDQVQLGEEVIITRRGRPVAKLVPNDFHSAQPVAQGTETEVLPAAASNSR
jgi:prevent-host-death family protein